jgi:hypothetical protein
MSQAWIGSTGHKQQDPYNWQSKPGSLGSSLTWIDGSGAIYAGNGALPEELSPPVPWIHDVGFSNYWDTTAVPPEAPYVCGRVYTQRPPLGDGHYNIWAFDCQKGAAFICQCE